jgi:hypothetical protein
MILSRGAEVSESIRPYQRGDEEAQVAIYNAAAASLPGFKPAQLVEQVRRLRAPGFDPESRLYLQVQDRLVGYITSQDNGRISYPWLLPGWESHRETLLDAMLTHLRSKEIDKPFAAYRLDWEPIQKFFFEQGFRKVREMLNYRQHLTDLPTMVNRRGLTVTHLKKEDLPDLERKVPNLLKLTGEALEKYLFANPFFSAESIFVLRKSDGTPHGYGMLIHDSQYADVNQLDPWTPCFHLGAFGTEGMSTKRVNALFSIIVEATRDTHPLGLDLLWVATRRLDDSDVETLAAQVASDVPHLVSFYDKYFLRQGGFPIMQLS